MVICVIEITFFPLCFVFPLIVSNISSSKNKKCHDIRYKKKKIIIKKRNPNRMSHDTLDAVPNESNPFSCFVFVILLNKKRRSKEETKKTEKRVDVAFTV